MAYIGTCFYCGFSGMMDRHVCRSEVEYWKNKATGKTVTGRKRCIGKIEHDNNESAHCSTCGMKWNFYRNQTDFHLTPKINKEKS